MEELCCAIKGGSLQVEVCGIREWPRNTTDKKLYEILRCAQILRCSKSKYLSFFGHAGMDVTEVLNLSADSDPLIDIRVILCQHSLPRPMHRETDESPHLHSRRLTFLLYESLNNLPYLGRLLKHNPMTRVQALDSQVLEEVLHAHQLESRKADIVLLGAYK